MSKKKRKPPVDPDVVRARLDHARQQQLVVRVRRWIPGSDRVDGFVVGTGPGWVAIHRTVDRSDLDGWELLRIEDIQAVSVDVDRECFEIAALRARGLWPPRPADGLDLHDTVSALRSAPAVLVSVLDEFEQPHTSFIGAVASVDDAHLWLREVSTRGGWGREPTVFSTQDLTRVGFGSRYEDALRLVAGPPPAT